MEKNIHTIIKELKSKISAKYIINEFKVFGSSARGDRHKNSDIDVLILLPVATRQIEEDLFDIAYDLELKYDCLIDLIVLDDRFLAGQNASLPIYQKAISEGLSV